VKRSTKQLLLVKSEQAAAAAAKKTSIEYGSYKTAEQ
jgi:hypothetical protein